MWQDGKNSYEEESSTGNHEGKIQEQDTISRVTSSSNLYQAGSYAPLSRVEGALVGGKCVQTFVIQPTRQSTRASQPPPPLLQLGPLRIQGYSGCEFFAPAVRGNYRAMSHLEIVGSLLNWPIRSPRFGILLPQWFRLPPKDSEIQSTTTYVTLVGICHYGRYAHASPLTVAPGWSVDWRLSQLSGPTLVDRTIGGHSERLME